MKKKSKEGETDLEGVWIRPGTRDGEVNTILSLLLQHMKFGVRHPDDDRYYFRAEDLEDITPEEWRNALELIAAQTFPQIESVLNYLQENPPSPEQRGLADPVLLKDVFIHHPTEKRDSSISVDLFNMLLSIEKYRKRNRGKGSDIALDAGRLAWATPEEVKKYYEWADKSELLPKEFSDEHVKELRQVLAELEEQVRKERQSQAKGKGEKAGKKGKKR